MVEVGSSILFSSPVMKIILYNRQLSDGEFFYGNSHRGKKNPFSKQLANVLLN